MFKSGVPTQFGSSADYRVQQISTRVIYVAVPQNLQRSVAQVVEKDASIFLRGARKSRDSAGLQVYSTAMRLPSGRFKFTSNYQLEMLMVEPSPQTIKKAIELETLFDVLTPCFFFDVAMVTGFYAGGNTWYDRQIDVDIYAHYWPNNGANVEFTNFNYYDSAAYNIGGSGVTGDWGKLAPLYTHLHGYAAWSDLPSSMAGWMSDPKSQYDNYARYENFTRNLNARYYSAPPLNPQYVASRTFIRDAININTPSQTFGVHRILCNMSEAQYSEYFQSSQYASWLSAPPSSDSLISNADVSVLLGDYSSLYNSAYYAGDLRYRYAFYPWLQPDPPNVTYSVIDSVDTRKFFGFDVRSPRLSLQDSYSGPAESYDSVGEYNQDAGRFNLLAALDGIRQSGALIGYKTQEGQFFPLAAPVIIYGGYVQIKPYIVWENMVYYNDEIGYIYDIANPGYSYSKQYYSFLMPRGKAEDIAAIGAAILGQSRPRYSFVSLTVP